MITYVSALIYYLTRTLQLFPELMKCALGWWTSAANAELGQQCASLRTENKDLRERLAAVFGRLNYLEREACKTDLTIAGIPKIQSWELREITCSIVSSVGLDLRPS